VELLRCLLYTLLSACGLPLGDAAFCTRSAITGAAHARARLSPRSGSSAGTAVLRGVCKRVSERIALAAWPHGCRAAGPPYAPPMRTCHPRARAPPPRAQTVPYFHRMCVFSLGAPFSPPLPTGIRARVAAGRICDYETTFAR